MSVTTTVAPSLPRISAEARPMPLAPPVTSAIFPATRPAIVTLPSLNRCDEVVQRLVERPGLIDVRCVPGIRDHDLRGVRDLCAHVVGSGEKWRVLVAHQD